jgi:hypothetical protein
VVARPPSNVGVGDGWYVIYDDSYQPIARCAPGTAGRRRARVPADARDTALMTIYHRPHVDLRSIGGPKDGLIWDGIVQGGRHPYRSRAVRVAQLSADRDQGVVLEPAQEAARTKPFPYDYIHVNSIDEEPNGNLLISGRNTHAVYEVSRKTGKILWRLGGKKSTFSSGPACASRGSTTSRRQPTGRSRLRQRRRAAGAQADARPRAALDEQNKRATLVRSYHHPKKLLSPFEGNAQFLPDGHVFVGWGAGRT